jgi:glyceraldehyde-3-phosphate dehydrogenase (NADP+)
MNRPMLIDGEWLERDEWLVVEDPDSGDEVGRVPVAGPADVDRAVEAATRAYRRRLPGHERSRLLSDVAHLLEERLEEAAELVATEGIKTINEARAEARRAVVTLQLSAEQAKRLSGQTLNLDQHPSGMSMFGLSVREPIGVVGAITPFNDPLNLVAHKVGPALASGNAVIVKPDSKTPLSALLLAAIFDKAGLPPGYLQVITGHGSVVGDAIVRHPGVGMISFTGGVEAGKAIHARAGLKEISMELGANNAVVVAADADLDLAAERIGSGAFWAAGQNCLHVQRVVAHEDVMGELTDRLVDHAESLVLAPKLDEASDMGPMIDPGAAERTRSMVSDAVNLGGELLCGGQSEGTRFEPTYLSRVPPGARLQSEEVYGPVTLIDGFTDLVEAIERANDTDYGLAGAVFTSDIETAFAVASRLRAGQVMINESTDFRIDAMPFGGGGSSGIGREGIAHAVEEMTEPKVVAFAGVEVPGMG